MKKKVEERIPKIIHYCWFGNGQMPKALEECLASWKKYMPEYEIKRCDESLCSFTDNEFVKRAYEQKRWAFLSDYYRLKMLYEYGGIYLDTDVRVRKSLNPLLGNKCFFNFIYDCIIGCGVIGAEPHNPFIGKLVELYDTAVFVDETPSRHVRFENGVPVFSYFDTNNYMLTLYVLQNYPEFRLNNRYQDLKDFVIYPKELFEIGSLLYRHYAVHLAATSWKTTDESSLARKEEKNFVLEYLRIIRRSIRYKKNNKKLGFYKYQVAQKKNIPIKYE